MKSWNNVIDWINVICLSHNFILSYHLANQGLFHHLCAYIWSKSREEQKRDIRVSNTQADTEEVAIQEEEIGHPVTEIITTAMVKK